MSPLGVVEGILVGVAVLLVGWVARQPSVQKFVTRRILRRKTSKVDVELILVHNDLPVTYAMLAILITNNDTRSRTVRSLLVSTDLDMLVGYEWLFREDPTKDLIIPPGILDFLLIRTDPILVSNTLRVHLVVDDEDITTNEITWEMPIGLEPNSGST